MATHGESNGNDNKKSKTDIFVFLVEPSIDFGPKFAETPNCSRGFQDWCGISHGFPMDDTDFPWMTHSTRYQPSRIFTMESQVPVYWKPSTAPRIDSARNEAAGCCWPQVKRGKVAISSWGAGKEQICGVVKTCENYGLWLFGDKPKEQQ